MTNSGKDAKQNEHFRIRGWWWIDPATTEICAKVPPKLKNKAFHMILLCTIPGYTHKGIKASSP